MGGPGCRKGKGDELLLPDVSGQRPNGERMGRRPCPTACAMQGPSRPHGSLCPLWERRLQLTGLSWAANMSLLRHPGVPLVSHAPTGERSHAQPRGEVRKIPLTSSSVGECAPVSQRPAPICTPELSQGQGSCLISLSPLPCSTHRSACGM